MKHVLNVGQCAMDHGSIRQWIEDSFDAHVVPAHDARDALKQLRCGHFDLVLVNRKLDSDGSDGLEIVRAVKADASLAALPIMLVSNYPDAQAEAVAAGAIHGFGKAQLANQQSLERLRAVLE